MRFHLSLLSCFIAAIIVLPNVLFAQPYPEVKVSGSEIRTLTFAQTGQEYLLQVSLPVGYDKSDKKYPVLYLMDSQWDFPLVAALYGEQYYDGFLPQMVIIGITWGGSHPNPDSLRARDYTPTNEKRLPQSGGADQFLRFIKEDVFPFVAKNYRTKENDKTLMGCSLGGLFTLYTLFTQPHLFNRYVAASPAFMWDNNVLEQFGKKYAANRDNPPAKLFMCVGGVEMSVPGFKKLSSDLNNYQLPNLEIESRILDNTGHSGTKGEGYARGLQSVFKRASLQLSPETLSTYSGIYHLADGTLVQLTTENGMLVETEMNTTYPLQAANETDFYATASFHQIHFLKNESGRVSGFQLERYGSSEFATKTK